MRTLLAYNIFCFIITTQLWGQTYRNIEVNSSITEVQPMTGIVLWNDNDNNQSYADAISLEYTYMKYNDIVKQKGVYNWNALESVLNDIASRNHQAIIRFYFVYPKDAPLRDGKTTVPDYIKNLDGYADFKGKGDGAECYYPDWRNEELQRFTIEFYTKLAEKYENDPRLAFIQTGFGLWSEYHTWSGQITVDGKTYKESKMVGLGFPSKEFQKKFLVHLDSTFINTPWSISIDAADADYSPMETDQDLRKLSFGLFDDSFMSEEHDDYNKFNWLFFGDDKYETTPAGGEFNYYTTADQKGVLDPNGWRGRTYEQAAAQYHITYMIGNDQPEYRPMARIKEASMASGYKFKLEKFQVSTAASKVVIKNTGIAPIYYDAFPSVNGTRATESLKGLLPGDSKEYLIQSGGDNPAFTIECDHLLPGQNIQFEGNFMTGTSLAETKDVQVFVINKRLSITGGEDRFHVKIIDLAGKIVKEFTPGGNEYSLVDLADGIYFAYLSSGKNIILKKIINQ